MCTPQRVDSVKYRQLSGKHQQFMYAKGAQTTAGVVLGKDGSYSKRVDRVDVSSIVWYTRSFEVLIQ